MENKSAIKTSQESSKKTDKVLISKIFCAGEDDGFHPIVYIKFKTNEDSVKCSYCGKEFYLVRK